MSGLLGTNYGWIGSSNLNVLGLSVSGTGYLNTLSVSGTCFLQNLSVSGTTFSNIGSINTLYVTTFTPTNLSSNS